MTQSTCCKAGGGIAITQTVEGVWFTRVEAERFGKQTHYRYPHGHRVYCVCADGELAGLLKSVTTRPGSRQTEKARP